MHLIDPHQGTFPRELLFFPLRLCFPISGSRVFIDPTAPSRPPMNIIRLLPVLISLLLLAAHFFRAGQMPVVLLVLLSPGLLLFRRVWAVRIMQGVLLAGGLEWIRTAVVLAMFRHELGLPWLRLVLILGSVALLTIGSMFVFQSASLRERYGNGGPASSRPPVS